MNTTPTSPPRRRGAQDKPALLSTAAPTPAASTIPAAATTADAATAPVVSSTEPLPADQATAAKVSVAPTGVIADPVGEVDRPAVVPEDVPLDRLTPPTADTSITSDVVMEQVPGTVPLPSDQITPVAPARAGSFFEAFHRELATLSDEERAMVRTSLFGDDDRRVDVGAGYADAEEARGGVRLFPVAYDVDHDGRLYVPGGVPVALTFAEHERLFRATAVRVGWLSGEVPTLDA